MIVPNSKVTIIMYHFVRDLKNSRYPDIKGLEVSHFREQIKYLQKHYQFISMEMLIDAIENNTSLPKKSVLLTFDDAYIDHYDYVFPILNEFKIQGAFYPPAKAVKEHIILDVNKIHFILAASPDKAGLITDIYEQLDRYREEYQLQDNDYYYNKLAKARKFDSAEIIFIKRLLQVELEEELRKKITNSLFEKAVDTDQESFSKELYMSVDQIKEMHHNGMHIGSHGYDHYWLNSLRPEKQRQEIEKSLEFLKEIEIDMQSWTMCYPYGGYDQSVIEILKEYNCKLALTTEVNIANLSSHGRFELPRLDTNDIPKSSTALVNIWHHKG